MVEKHNNKITINNNTVFDRLIVKQNSNQDALRTVDGRDLMSNYIL